MLTAYFKLPVKIPNRSKLLNITEFIFTGKCDKLFTFQIIYRIDENIEKESTSPISQNPFVQWDRLRTQPLLKSNKQATPNFTILLTISLIIRRFYYVDFDAIVKSCY